MAIAVATTAGAVIDDFSQGALLLQPTNYSPAMVEVQSGFETNFIIGGARRVEAASHGEARMEIDSVEGKLICEVVSEDGYFIFEYGSEAPLGVNLRADGSDAFLLTFSDVYMPGLWRGTYKFTVDGKSYDLLNDLKAMDGAGTILIPFSYFSQSWADRIRFDAWRVEEPYRFVLDSIVTVKTPVVLRIVALASDDLRIGWSTNATSWFLESTLDYGSDSWARVTNAVRVVDGEYTVTVQPSGTMEYFRLHEPQYRPRPRPAAQPGLGDDSVVQVQNTEPRTQPND